MRTLTLNIEENIYEKVKTFLSLFSPDKVQIAYNKTEADSFINETYLSPIEVAKMKQFFRKHNIPVPEDMDKIPLAYNEDDLETDLNNLQKLNLLK